MQKSASEADGGREREREEEGGRGLERQRERGRGGSEGGKRKEEIKDLDNYVDRVVLQES